MYTVEKECSTLELMEYLEVAPVGMVVMESGDRGRSFFKMSDGSWSDEDANKYGNIDVALEIEGNFKPFKLNEYRLYIGNVFSYRVWYNIEVDDNYSAVTIREHYLKYLLDSVGVTKNDKSMHIHAIFDATVPIMYMVELIKIFEELDIDNSTISINTY